MAQQCSFDVTSNVDLQEVDNALNQARKEVAQRYDFKGAKASIEFDTKESKLVLVADDEFKLNALWEIVQTRLVRRNVPVKNLTRGAVIAAANSTVRQEISLQQGIPVEKAKDIVKFLKDAKLKRVQASIQGDQLRVTSPSKDDLQDAMRQLREQDFGVALQFGNYRGIKSFQRSNLGTFKSRAVPGGRQRSTDVPRAASSAALAAPPSAHPRWPCSDERSESPHRPRPASCPVSAR